MPPFISVVVCALNDEKYVKLCLNPLFRYLKGNFDTNHEVFFIADKCTDDTIKEARNFEDEQITIIEKDKKWKNGYAEALQIGLKKATGHYFSIVDCDTEINSDFFDLIDYLAFPVVSVSPRLVTKPTTLLNKIYHQWKKGIHRKEPEGASRIILRSALKKIGGFRDVLAPDTDIDNRLREAGYKSLLIPQFFSYEIRELSLRHIVKNQIRSGKARYELGQSLLKTLGHSIIRIRPLVIGAYLFERLKA